MSCIPDNFPEKNDFQAKLSDLFTEENLFFNEQNGNVSFSEQIEDEFFRLLLPNKSTKSLCRYTSLNSLFWILKSQKHCLCSLTCMNDKGEMSYADKYIGNEAYAYVYSRQVIEENNNCFILSSCSDKKSDDLTMWRLYGDQCKGVCLQYGVNKQLVDNKQYFLEPVSYAKDTNNHPQLDIVRNINAWRFDGWHFCFNRWYIWKHFFKSHLFKDEDEYRLLYIPSKESNVELQWIVDSTNSIVSRIALFKINDNTFPLILESVLVGPKCPEQESNVDQLTFMNRVQGVMKSQGNRKVIRPSEINDYR